MVKREFYAKIASATAFGLFIAHTVLWYHYAFAGHSAKQPDAGRVYPLNTHGSISYLTSYEHSMLYFTVIAALAFFLFAYFLMERFKPKAPRD